MNTKVTIIGESPAEKKKPIELFASLNTDRELILNHSYEVKDFENAELIALGYDTSRLIDHKDNFDLIFCYNKERREGVFFLGKFNDGVVE